MTTKRKPKEQSVTVNLPISPEVNLLLERWQQVHTLLNGGHISKAKLLNQMLAEALPGKAAEVEEMAEQYRRQAEDIIGGIAAKA